MRALAVVAALGDGLFSAPRPGAESWEQYSGAAWVAAGALEQAARGELAQALPGLERAWSMEPTDVVHAVNVGVARLRLGDVDGAAAVAAALRDAVGAAPGAHHLGCRWLRGDRRRCRTSAGW